MLSFRSHMFAKISLRTRHAFSLSNLILVAASSSDVCVIFYYQGQNFFDYSLAGIGSILSLACYGTFY